MKALSLEACKKVIGAGIFDPEQPIIKANSEKATQQKRK